MPAPPRLAPGRTWSGYCVDSMLGEGTGGAVYLVQRVEDETWWALKVLTTVGARQRLRVEREAIVRDSLRHPNIVPALQAIDVDGHPGLVMDFIEGPTLDVWVKTHDPDLVARLQVFRNILGAVQFAHEQGFVHRDIKPSNVLMQPHGPAFLPRVADFGLAKALAPPMGKFGGLTTVNTGLGSPGYAAPEQIRDASSVDERADIFSLGCVLYELMCGTGPFAGMSTFEVLRASSRGAFTDPATLAVGVPSDVLAMIVEMMAPDPTDRPRSARTVLQRLDQAIATVSANGRTDWTEPSRGAPLPRLLAALVALPVVGLFLGTVAVFVF